MQRQTQRLIIDSASSTRLSIFCLAALVTATPMFVTGSELAAPKLVL
jgi:hypothetical protein